MFRPLTRYILAALTLLIPAAAVAIDMEPAPADRVGYTWKKKPGELKHDKYGVIDPSPDVISLEFLPTDDYGFVDWTKALNEGIISPKETLDGKAPRAAKQADAPDVVIRSKMDFMPDVLFPHKAHTDWLKCGVCHPKIFKPRAGANPITMTGIWKGEFCGRCHDKVAFPTRNCFRCHSVKRTRGK